MPNIDSNGYFINNNKLIEKEYEKLFKNKDKKFFKKLSTIKKKEYIDLFKNINLELKTPLQFIIINSKMDINTKKIALNAILRLNNLDKDSSEYNKLNNWIQELIKIPFNIYNNLSINYNSSINEKNEFLINTKKCLDNAVHGHISAKQHILQVISKWITNDKSDGNILALQGPMGNGKTTLVKDGISKSINRPFSFIALGGTSDVSYFNGHGYTYEGSKCGIIVDILKKSKCMNPIIYFDELDKVSDTYRGQEIIHMLTHMTDSSQNSLFMDNYFHGVDIDLSKVLFIFSFNDETKIDKILKDRMYVINTSGYKLSDKIIIAENYLLPKLIETYKLNNKIVFNYITLKYIIDNFTYGEEGVRNLNRCLETIISKFNLYLILNSDDTKKSRIDLDFKLNNFSIPHIFTIDNIDSLLKKKKFTDNPPEHMYV
uniref:ATPase AAA-type core domain-containing protein n=1 Tax=viral metagenome TaxID=1070528 RepID=A0A6C0CZG4_9ZZZZ